jgi:hypothetical protein
MRKLSLAAAMTTVLLSACKKDFTCECKSSNGTVIERSTITTTQKKASGTCSDMASQYQAVNPGATCSLK